MDEIEQPKAGQQHLLGALQVWKHSLPASGQAVSPPRTQYPNPLVKPAPDGYLLGAKCLGVDPAACLVFEDAPAGIVAARAAGARAIGLTTTHRPGDLSGVDATIADFRGIDIRPEPDAFVVTLPSQRTL